MFQRIWQWLKQLWQRWVARQPPPAPTRQPPSDAESESVFMQLLQEVASGRTRGEIQGFLIIQQGKKHVTEADLVAWLRRASSSWLASPAQHQELGRRMGRLGDIYKGELAEVARDISRQLVVENKPSVQSPSDHTSTTLTNHPSVPSNHTSTTPTNHPSVSSNHRSTTPTNQPSVTQPPTINPEAATLYQQGVDSYYAGNVLGALALFERAVAIDPNFHYAWSGLGNALNGLQRYEEAIAAYEQAVAIDSKNHIAWNGLGATLNDVQRYDEAIAAFERALAIDSKNHIAWNGLGATLNDVQRYDEAIAAYERALAIDSNYHLAWNGLGATLKDVQRYDEAIAAYERAVAIDSNYHYAWNGLGNALKGVQRYDEAIAAYERAVAIDSNYHYAWNGLGNALKGVQRYDEAIAAYERALAIDSNYHFAWNGLGNALNDVQRYDEAIAACERALAIDSNLHPAWNGLGNALSGLQRYDEAIAACERALAIDSNLHHAWNGLGNALSGLQRYDEAIKKFDRALQITKDQYWIAWFNRGWAFFNSHRYHLAIQNWDDGINKYLQTNPDWKVAHGSLYQQKGQAQYLHGRQTTQYFPYFLEAKTSYQKALEFLDRPNELRLEVLQEAIPVFRALNDAAASEYLNQQGIEILQDLISAASSPAHKLRLERQFSSFYQLEVDNLVQSGDFPLALTQAEKRKNYCLRWLRQGWMENLEDSPTCEQIHQLLHPGTAIIYWHISPAAITTFILRQNQPLHAQIFTEDMTSIGADKELYKFETWLKEWKTDYQNYCEPKRSPLAPLKKGGTGKESETAFFDQKPANNSEAPLFKSDNSKAPLFKGGWGDLPSSNQETPNNSESLFKGGGGDLPSKETHPWRVKMPDRLNQLAEILHIPQILTALGDNIAQLILIPHRDLHLLPLESLFSQPAITRLPSAQIGIQQLSQTPPPSNSLLLIAQSQGKSNLKFPAIEAAAISQIYPCRRPPSSASKSATIQELQATDGIFHFTGHAQHNTANPAASALILADGAEITLLDIFGLDFPSYYLVCLSGCETGIAGKLGLIDEFVSLASGFLPRTTYVISTLWRVDDRSSALLTIYFYLLCQKNPTPPAALEQAKAWLRTLTNGKLGQWYQQVLLPLLRQNQADDSIIEYLEMESDSLLENFATINEQPYQHPYHWAGFTIAGQE